MRRAIDHVLSGEIDPRPVGVVRIAVGLAAILKGILSYGQFTRLLQDDVVRARDLWLVPDLSPALLPLLIAVWLASAVGFTVGFATRLSGGVLSAAIWYRLLVDQNLYSNNLYLLGIFCVLLTIADSGAALALDARRRRRNARIPYWPVWLMKVQLSIMYAWTALAKALNEGWVSGSVLYRELLLPWRFKQPEILQAVAALVIVVEVFLAVALWLPRSRKYAFVIGGLFHALMPLMLPGYAITLVAFQLITLAAYILFLDAGPAPQTVLWHERCPFCATLVRWLRRLDWLSRYRFVGFVPSAPASGETATRIAVSGDATAGLQLLDGRRRMAGIDAIRGVMEGLPLSCFWAPLLATLPIRPLADRAYRYVRERRCVAPPNYGELTPPKHGDVTAFDTP